MPYAALPGLVRAGAVYYDLSLGYLDEDGIAGRPGFGEATVQYGFNDYVSGYSGANATTDYYSTLVGSAFNTYWGALAVDLSRSAAKGRERGWQEGYRWRVSASKSFASDTRMLVLDEPQQRRQLSFHSRRRPGARPSPQRLAGDDPLQRDVVSSRPAAAACRLTESGVRMSATTAGAPISWGTPTAMVSSITTCTPSRVRIFITAIIRWWASPFAASSGLAGSLTTRFNHDKNYGSQLQSSYTGSAGEKNAFSYGLTASYDMPRENPHEASVRGNGSLRTDYAYLNASASAGRHQQQYCWGIGRPGGASGRNDRHPRTGKPSPLWKRPARRALGWQTASDSQ